MVTKEQFTKFILGLKKVLPKYAPELDNAMIEAWYQAFKSYTADELVRVYVTLRDTEMEFPSIAKIKQLLSKVSTAESRFDELVGLIGTYGAYRPPQTDAMMIRTVNRLGGWQRVCEWSNEELPYRKRDFDAAYGDVLQQEALGHNAHSEVPHLGGIHEISGPDQHGQIIRLSPARESQLD
jgi:hypothetical protein